MRGFIFATKYVFQVSFTARIKVNVSLSSKSNFASITIRELVFIGVQVAIYEYFSANFPKLFRIAFSPNTSEPLLLNFLSLRLVGRRMRKKLLFLRTPAQEVNESDRTIS